MNTNDNASLAEELMAQLQGAPMQQIAQQLGSNPQETGSAVSMALPMLLGALGHNAQQPGGADSLMNALQGHMPSQQPQAALGGMGGLDLGGLLGSVLGGGGAAGGSSSMGADILGHIFGGKQDRAGSSLGQASGLGAGGGQLLQILAPIVMAFLANRVSSGGMDTGGLGNMLGQEKTRAQQQGGAGGGLLGSLLDQDGDGQVGIGDLLKMGTSFLGGRR
ncbi:DUF937 domain-containing protein [Diaphorobacter aerolatus]|uniref:DUF937 domain-containing protein n=1 Tax=Diaphorobacter aerolatus TaxID=1288495 RepID=A0A7H0GMC9_9BURK|nr:DUF937 domain-containing protein [Diaphorobacter aerolatus]QNP49445.1 DUF937 domain-containing protein [Diaphorobacter aerolatus]